LNDLRRELRALRRRDASPTARPNAAPDRPAGRPLQAQGKVEAPARRALDHYGYLPTPGTVARGVNAQNGGASPAAGA
jgi:hypothetical protein